MNSILRTLIVWLVLLAVPFPGFASAAMSGCAAGHASRSLAAPASQDHDAHAGHLEAMQAEHDHAAMMAGMHDADGDAQHGVGKCSACSACSIGAAIVPAPLPALAIHAPPAWTIPFTTGRVPSVHLALPERPPRAHGA